MTESSSSLSTSKEQVRVVSFDLDNTVWKTGPTIAAANDALASFLDQHNIHQPQRVEHVMKDLFLSNKTKYAPVAGDAATSPVLLTQLRMDAIHNILTEHNGFTTANAASFAAAAFSEWTNGRHDAIPNHFAASVQSCLEDIMALKCCCSSSSGGATAATPVLVGAITDGNSDPRLVNDELAACFDFCVNAETVGVSKPDKRVFLEAVRQVLNTSSLAAAEAGAGRQPHPAVQGLLPDNHGDDDDIAIWTDEKVEDFIGPWWVHVGDDFVKDVVAAKSLNMRSIWSRELVMDNQQKSSLNDKKNNDNDNKKSAKSAEDFVQQVSEMKGKVIQMQVGADDYLADSLRAEFADGVADTFADVATILQKWHEKA